MVQTLPTAVDALIRLSQRQKIVDGPYIKLNGKYVLVHTPEHPYRDEEGYYPLHRLVLEKHLRRYLTSRETVKHKNKDPLDNKLKNLELATEISVDGYSKTLTKRQCKRCKKYFIPNNLSKLYCSPRCAELIKAAFCIYCEKRFEHPARKERKYCSPECSQKAQREAKKPKKGICGYCKKPFFYKGNKERKYCSQECHKKMQQASKKVVEKVCRRCKKTFTHEGVKGGYCSPKCAKKTKTTVCSYCGESLEYLAKYKVQKYCSYDCHNADRRKRSNKPAKEVLQKEVWEYPCTELAKKYGVSDKAVEKWCRGYEIDKPPRGYWAKQKAKGKSK